MTYLYNNFMGYKSYKIKFTLLKCVTQWFLVYAQSFAAITTV